jgi:acyl-CoA thioester hydrolase
MSANGEQQAGGQQTGAQQSVGVSGTAGAGGSAPDDWRTRADFRVFRPLQTRWMDNDVYGHVNNVVYYSYFDTAVNGWLMEATGQDIRQLPAIGVVAETSCRYFSELSFPDALDSGLRIERLGKSSIVYRIGLFRGAAMDACAAGRFVHVYVDAVTRKPVPIPEAIRAVAATLV